MLIETWVAVFIALCIFICAIVSGIGWIIEGERRAQTEKENKKLRAENGKLYKIIEHQNGLLNVQAADDYANKVGERNV